MTFCIDDTLLAEMRLRLRERDDLRWIIGGAGSGKSTISRILAERFGLHLYDMDAHIYGTYHRHFDARLHPVNTLWSGEKNPLSWQLGMPWEEFLSFQQAALVEYLDLLCRDLADLTGGVIVDGGVVSAAVLAQAVPADRAICLEAAGQSSRQIWEANPERLAMRDMVERVQGIDAPWQVFLEFDRMITQTLLSESRSAGIAVLQRTPQDPPEDTAEQAARLLGLSPKMRV